MIDFAPLLKIFPIFAVALAVPGPDFLFVSSISLSRGRMGGMKAAAGIATGIMCYALLSLWGLIALFDKVVWLVMVIKILGGLYLIYLGTLLWRAAGSKNDMPHTTAKKPVSVKNAYVAGCLTTLTNPKTVVFFTSVFALILTPETSMETRVALVLMMTTMTFLWYSFVTLGLSNSAVRERYYRMRKSIDRIAGSVMILFGAKLVSSATD